VDSPLEEAGFEPSVPLYILTVSAPLLVGPVTVPFANPNVFDGSKFQLKAPGTRS
jgi:hypothetical protein